MPPTSSCLSSILVLSLHPLLSCRLVLHLVLGTCTPAHTLHHHVWLLLSHCGVSGWVLVCHSLHSHHAGLLHAHTSHSWLLHAHHRHAHARRLHSHAAHSTHTWLLHSHASHSWLLHAHDAHTGLLHARLLHATHAHAWLLHSHAAHTGLLHARLLLAHHSRLLLLLLLLHAAGLLLLLLSATCSTSALDNVILAPLNAIILDHTGKVRVEFLHFIIVELAVLTQTDEHHVDAFFEVEGAHLGFLFSAVVRLDLGPARHHWLLGDITARIRHNDIVQNFLHLDILQSVKLKNSFFN